MTDLIFLGACDAHDQCWSACNGPEPPYLGLAHKAQCDFGFLAHMEAACTFWAPLLAYPVSGWVDADDFFEDCTQIAAGFYGLVSAAVPIYWKAQCCRGCNTQACTQTLLVRPWQCGRGQCWLNQPAPIPPPVPCLGISGEETATWIVNSAGEPMTASEQLGFGLERSTSRPESRVYLEEWAVLSSKGRGPVVQLATSDGFGTRVTRSLSAFASSTGGEGSALVVEVPIHPRGARYIPTPMIEPFTVSLGEQGLARSAALDFWFRAEVDTGGRVDRLAFLESLPVPSEGVVDQAIREHLRLAYADERRHRSVVFAQGRVGGDGLLEVEDGIVVVARCCSDCCWHPELNDYVCPCAF